MQTDSQGVDGGEDEKVLVRSWDLFWLGFNIAHCGSVASSVFKNTGRGKGIIEEKIFNDFLLWIGQKSEWRKKYV